MHRDGAVQGRERSPSLRLPHGREEDSSRSLLSDSGVRTRSDLLRGSSSELLPTSGLVLPSSSQLLPLVAVV